MHLILQRQREQSLQQQLLHQNSIIKRGSSSKLNQTARMIFEQTQLYKERPCITCNITRKPRTSHCKVCNNCVKGFDHHCTLLNNCIGARNLRSFNLLLLSAWFFFLLGLAFGFCALAYDQLVIHIFSVSVVQWNADFVLTLAILGLQVIKVLMLLCCRSRISFGMQIIMVFIELAVSSCLAIAQWNLEKSLSAYLLSLSVSMLILETPLLRQHLYFISVHMTQKELVARKQTAA